MIVSIGQASFTVHYHQLLNHESALLRRKNMAYHVYGELIT